MDDRRDEQVLELQEIKEDQQAHHGRLDSGHGLSDLDHAAPGRPIGDDPTDQGEPDHRDRTCERYASQGRVGSRELERQVGRDEHLHHHAGHLGDHSEEVPAELALFEGVEGTQRSGDALDPAGLGGDGRRYGGGGRVAVTGRARRLRRHWSARLGHSVPSGGPSGSRAPQRGGGAAPWEQAPARPRFRF